MLETDVPEKLAGLPCKEYDSTPCVDGPDLASRRIALISTAGLMHQGDEAFSIGSCDYRVLDIESERPLLMGHISTNFDRTGFIQDQNVVFPVDRLTELANKGIIGSCARFHYAFMGATDPDQMDLAVQQLAKTLKGDAVDLVLLVPV